MSLQETLGLAALMRATLDHFREGFGLPPPDRFVLIVDQAEELYTRAGEAEAHRFSEIVVAGLHDPTLTLLASLRSDHYGHFQADAQLFANSVMVDVPPLREEGLRQVVERPPALLGAHFEDGNMGERVVNATARQPGALPLLSYLLEDLWKGMQRRADGVLRWSDYPELVGVRGVLARRAEEFFEICREGDQAVLQRLFTLRLSRPRARFRAGEPDARNAARVNGASHIVPRGCHGAGQPVRRDTVPASTACNLTRGRHRRGIRKTNLSLSRSVRFQVFRILRKDH
jgi:hypothetical protein